MLSKMLQISICLIFQVCISWEKINGVEITNRIADNLKPLREMGGTAALHNSASDLQSNTNFCGAVLISDRFLLTAAHCIRGNERLISISLGREDLDIDPVPGINTYQVQERYIHPSYIISAKDDYSDIAILKTDRQVRYTEDIWPFCLPNRNQVFNSMLVQIAGWGHVNGAEKSSNIQTKFIYLNDNVHCQSIWRDHSDAASNFFDRIINSSYPNGLDSRLLCAGREGIDVCKGDSGGPMVYKNGGLQTVIGIISKGIRSCPPFPVLPSFYTNVAHYIDWIYRTTGLQRSLESNNCGGPNLSQLISTPCASSQISTNPSSSCDLTWHSIGLDHFVIFNETMDWNEGKALCQSYGLDLYKPKNILKVAKFLEDLFSNKWYWLAARGNGIHQVWLSGETLKRADPWIGNQYQNVGTDQCLNLITWNRNHEKGTVLDVTACTNGAKIDVLCGKLPSSGLSWHSIGRDQFVRFNEKMDWIEGQALCRSHGLNLYQPKNILAVAKFLEDNFSNKWYWLAARGNGTHIVWLSGETLTQADPWFGDNYQKVGTDHCLNLISLNGNHGKGTVLDVTACTNGEIIDVLCG